MLFDLPAKADQLLTASGAALVSGKPSSADLSLQMKAENSLEAILPEYDGSSPAQAMTERMFKHLSIENESN